MTENKYSIKYYVRISAVETAKKRRKAAEKELALAIKPILEKLIKDKNISELELLANALPDCMEKFFVFQAIEKIREI